MTMPEDMTTRVLTQALDLLSGPQGTHKNWCKHAAAMNDIGNRCSPNALTAVRWDLPGAIDRVIYVMRSELTVEESMTLEKTCKRFIQESIPPAEDKKRGTRVQYISEFNDSSSTRFQAVEEVLKKAINLSIIERHKATARAQANSQQGMEL